MSGLRKKSTHVHEIIESHNQKVNKKCEQWWKRIKMELELVYSVRSQIGSAY